MSYIAEQIGGGRVCDATTPVFFTVKNCVFCSNVRFWTFSASKCAMPLLQHFDDGDAGCALVRMGKKGRCPAPFSPLWQPLPRMVTPGGGAMFRRDIWGEFYGEKCGAINPTKSNALRECFLQ